MNITLTDNNPKSDTLPRSDVAALFPIADKTITDLCRENDNLIVFPYSIDASDDRIGNSTVMTINNTEDPEKVQIATGNVMGFIGVGCVKVKIGSRFDKGRGDYLLQRVLSFNIFNLNHSNVQEEVLDFTMFMFPYFLKSAMRQGIFREYQSFRHNDAHLKGTIDIGRHIASNTPFVGNVAYSTREHSQDNNMTELIRHTIEFMKTKECGRSVLNADRETEENVAAIIAHTPSYNKNMRNSVVSRSLRTSPHPFYTGYRPLQRLCLQILRMEEVKYGESDDGINGILFDGAWLWEEYVHTILRDLGFTHPENKLRKGGIYLFEDRTGERYPDFYKKDVVLDAKYKRLGSCDKVSEVDRNDLHQIIAYMDNLKASKGGFVAPLDKTQEKAPTSTLKGTTSTLSIFGITIANAASSYAEFCAMMKDHEKAFIKSISQASL